MQRLLTQDARIIRIEVGAQAGVGWRLDRYLAGLLPSMPRSLFQRWLRAGYITVDDRPAKAADEVRTAQRIVVVAPLPELPDDDRFDTSPLQVLYEGRGFVVVNKPPGQLAHQAGKVLSGTLLNQLMDWLSENGRDPLQARLVNRIDKDTSGIVLCAWDAAIAGRLGHALQDRQVSKVYLAIAEGCPDQTHGHWQQPIGLAPGTRLRRVVRADGQPCHTEWWLEEAAAERRYALLRIHLHTGRQHQIRVHAAHAGLPLVGDWLYGQPCHDIPGQCLHAHQLSFQDPEDGQQRTVTAPLPETLAELWSHLRDGGTVCPRPLTQAEHNKHGHTAEDEDQLADGWRRPSWMSREDWLSLRQGRA